MKPHGALYTTIVDSPEHAEAVAEAVSSLGSDVILLMPPEVEPAAARAGVPFVPEGYVDLDYDAVRQARARAREAGPRPPGDGRARSPARSRGDGPDDRRRGASPPGESICVHGDAPNAPEIAQAIRQALEADGIELAALAELRATAAA